MKQLSREAFESARSFLLEEGRPLEMAGFKRHFEGESIERVWDELAAYQNEDGGFGRALEPDLRTPSSSALATGMVLSSLVEYACPSDHPLVQKAVAYLLESFDQEDDVWRAVPQDANQHPHAPWWHDENGSLEKVFDGFRIIPRALILAGLHHYASLVPDTWLSVVTEKTVQYIEEVKVLGEGGGSDLEYAIKLAEAENLPGDDARRLRKRILDAIPKVVVRDPEMWDIYCIKPLGVAPAPDAIGADLLEDAIQQHLDYLIEHQSPEGCWEPTWTWGENYPDIWPQARREWQGILTLETLMQLQAFDRLDF